MVSSYNTISPNLYTVYYIEYTNFNIKYTGYIYIYARIRNAWYKILVYHTKRPSVL